jgi:hypothetical protein
MQYNRLPNYHISIYNQTERETWKDEDVDEKTRFKIIRCLKEVAILNLRLRGIIHERMCVCVCVCVCLCVCKFISYN